jgi:molybdopterin converting factor small subunit
VIRSRRIPKEEDLKVTVKLFGKYRRFAPPGSEGNIVAMEIGQGRILEDIFPQLGISKEEPKTVIRNHFIAGTADPLEEGDVVAIFPPMGVAG